MHVQPLCPSWGPATAVSVTYLCNRVFTYFTKLILNSPPSLPLPPAPGRPRDAKPGNQITAGTKKLEHRGPCASCSTWRCRWGAVWRSPLAVAVVVACALAQWKLQAASTKL